MNLRGLILAFQFLTRLPVPRIDDVEPQELARTAVWFPVVGLVIGAALALVVWIGTAINPWLAALLALLIWVAITGALHLDGLADITDALGASHGKPERFHEVLKDPHVGSFGVTAIVLQLMAKLILLAQIEIAELPATALVPALLLLPAWARWGPLVWTLAAPPPSTGPHADGMGAQFRSGQSWRPAAAYAAGLALVSLLLAPMLIAAIVIVPLIALYWRRRLGGMTGDCHGASVEVTETLLLAMLVLYWG